MNWLQKIAQNTNSEAMLQSLIPYMIPKVQQVYDQWDQSDAEFGDPELGFGGICQDIAEQISEVVNTKFEAITVDSQGVGDQHVCVMAKTPDGVFSVDIPPQYYETGGCYNWQKIEGVQFSPEFFVISLVFENSAEFDMYYE